MPLIDITNPAVIKFLIESHERTARLRVAWSANNRDLIKNASTLNREEKGNFDTDVLKDTMVQGMATIVRDNITERRHRRCKPIRDGPHINALEDLKKGHSIPEVGLGDPEEDPRLARSKTDSSPDPIMRPIDPEQKALIYKDLPTYGREVYLKSRNRMIPEKKYYFLESSGWQCGWRLKDSYFNGKLVPSYGRVWTLYRDTTSHSGPQPDPSHYNSPDFAGPQKCTL